MNAREVMTSPVISVTANTPVRDIAQLLLKNHISAVPILDYSGAPIGMVSEGDLIGRRERSSASGGSRCWREGESLSSDFLSGSYVAPERVAIEIGVKAGRHRRRGHGCGRDRAVAYYISDQARACSARRAGGRNRQPRESTAVDGE